MKKLRAWWRTTRVLFALCFRADPWRSAALFSCAALANLLLLTSTYGIRLVVDAVIRHDLAATYVAATVMAGAAALATALSSLSTALSVRVIEQTGFYVDAHLMRLAMAPPTIEHHERADYVNQMTLVRQERRAMAQMMNAAMLNVRVSVYLIGTIVLLARIDPILILVPVFGLPSVAAHRRSNQLTRRAREGNSQRIRQRNHLYRIVSAPASGKEVRIFGLLDELAARHRNISETINRETTRAAVRGAVLTSLGALVFAIGYTGAVLLVLRDAIGRPDEIGTVILAISLAALINTQLNGVAQNGAYFQQVAATATRLVWLTDYAARTAQDGHSHHDVPALLRAGITLDDVSFTYPGTSRQVLHGVSLTLPAGSVVALVGENGSGKTTLVKLLTGMYRPTSGQITIDGTPLADMDVTTWRRRLGGAFQDFVRFELKVGETVGLGDVPRMDDNGARSRALERAGATDLAQLGGLGLETPLGTRWGGVDLSGGQWQKTATSRAVMRDGPLLLVFDEPSAALDAHAEHELITHLAAAAKSAADTGQITLLISHRFTTVPMADLIVVLQEGRVSEVGNHAELMRRGGLYAELYDLQARAYR